MLAEVNPETAASIDEVMLYRDSELKVRMPVIAIQQYRYNTWFYTSIDGSLPLFCYEINLKQDLIFFRCKLLSYNR